MKLVITKKHIDRMIRGSSIYSTGGGIEYSTQKKLFKKLLSYRKKLELVSIDELKDTDYVCTAYAVGSAGDTNFDLSEELRLGLQTLEQYTGKKFKAVFAGETNIDILAFQAASTLGLPVLDADSNGGRAVPEIQFDNFVIAQIPLTPLVTIAPNGQVAILEQSPDILAIEKYVRGMLTLSGKGLIVVFDHTITVKDARKVLTQGIFSRSLELGSYIVANKYKPNILDGIVEKTGGKLLIHGKITKIETSNDPLGGFLHGYYYVRDEHKNTLKVFIKNENIICWLNRKLLLTPPDCILTIDAKSFLGIHNSKLKIGQEVIVIGKQATDLWRTTAGKQLFSPKHFGFKFPNKLL